MGCTVYLHVHVGLAGKQGHVFGVVVVGKCGSAVRSAKQRGGNVIEKSARVLFEDFASKRARNQGLVLWCTVVALSLHFR